MIAITRSAGPARSPSAVSRPAPLSSARLGGVAIIAAARVTPGTASMSRVRRMSVTESWYALGRTKFQTGIRSRCSEDVEGRAAAPRRHATHLGGMIPYARILR